MKKYSKLGTHLQTHHHLGSRGRKIAVQCQPGLHRETVSEEKNSLKGSEVVQGFSEPGSADSLSETLGLLGSDLRKAFWCTGDTIGWLTLPKTSSPNIGGCYFKEKVFVDKIQLRFLRWGDYSELSLCALSAISIIFCLYKREARGDSQTHQGKGDWAQSTANPCWPCGPEGYSHVPGNAGLQQMWEEERNKFSSRVSKGNTAPCIPWLWFHGTNSRFLTSR
jgi:hypothetical protein